MEPITTTSNWLYVQLEAEFTYHVETIPMKLRIMLYDIQLFWLSIKLAWIQG